MSSKTKKNQWIRKFEEKYGTSITDEEFISKHILKKAGIRKIVGQAKLASVIMNGPSRKMYKKVWDTHKVEGKNNYDVIVKSFTPNLTPRQMFLLGSFGGTYWRPITSGVTGISYESRHLRYPKSWWRGIPDSQMTRPFDQYDTSVNKYGVKVGTTLLFWESKSWITKWHPYGWVEWYCDWCMGKRCPDDIRQIKRWRNIAGERGRFRRMLINLIKKKGGVKCISDFTISPKIRQTLQHWACAITEDDFL